MTTPTARVLGVFSLPEIEKYVEAHYHDFAPPRTPKEVEAFKETIRDVLRRTVLVEVEINNKDSNFNPDNFRQNIDDNEKEWGHHWGSLFDIRCLSHDGSELLAEDPFSFPESLSSFRAVVFIRCWDSSRALMSSYGELSCPPISEMPQRLQRLTPYVACD
jgi:hypothetical protein